jgi:hypothetical protein
MHIISLVCTALRPEVNRRLSIGAALRGIARFCSENFAYRINDPEKRVLAHALRVTLISLVFMSAAQPDSNFPSKAPLFPVAQDAVVRYHREADNHLDQENRSRHSGSLSRSRNRVTDSLDFLAKTL